jgi:uncharacterized membrane protein
MKPKLEEDVLDAMSKNINNWKGVIYFNRKDTRLMVPKRYPSLGWTLNFANPYSYIALILLALIVIIATLLAK